VDSFSAKTVIAFEQALGPTERHIQLPQGAFFPGVNWPGSEINRSPPSSDGVWNVWNHNSFPIRFHGVMLNEAQRKHIYTYFS
jgi:hypothetical protein